MMVTRFCDLARSATECNVLYLPPAFWKQLLIILLAYKYS